MNQKLDEEIRRIEQLGDIEVCVVYDTDGGGSEFQFIQAKGLRQEIARIIAWYGSHITKFSFYSYISSVKL